MIWNKFGSTSWRGAVQAVGAELLLVVAFAMVPFVFGTQPFFLGELEAIGSLMLVAIGLNVCTGFAGQLSLGPSAVFAIGAFTAAVFANHFPHYASIFLLCVISAVAAAVGGLVIGLPALRIGGFYLALVTLFVALAIPTIANGWSVTGGLAGISLLSNPDFNQSIHGMALYQVTVLIVGLGLLGSAILRRSRLGRQMFVLKSSEELSGSLGLSNYRLKMLAFLISAVLGGVGGGLYVYTQQFMSGNSANVQTSIYLLAATIIGGLGTAAGPALGSALVFGLQYFLGFAQYANIVFGAALLVFALGLPDGLVGLIAWAAHWVRDSYHRAVAGPSVPRPHDAAETVPHNAAETVRTLLDGRGDAKATLSALELVRVFGGVAAVDGVTLDLSSSRVHGLIGSNGSGKTTLLNLLSGFYRPSSGRVEVGGEVLPPGRPDIAARRGLARTFQTPKLVTDETVFKNVLPVRRANRANRDERTQVDLALELLGLDALANTKVSDLPHGTRRLVEVARAVATRPLFLLLDEPAAGLAAGELDIIRSVIRALAGAGVGILLVEHNVPLVSELADEITVMHLGRPIAHGTPENVLENEEVARVFLGTTLTRAKHKDERVPR